VGEHKDDRHLERISKGSEETYHEVERLALK
jgi:hypothetical protein